MDKSSRFAAATQRAVQLDPFLDQITPPPTATLAFQSETLILLSDEE
jgi:hypothetical protein